MYIPMEANLAAWRNVHYKATFKFQDLASVPLDLTNTTVRMQIRATKSGAALITLTSSDPGGYQGIKMPVPSSGEFTVQIELGNVTGLPAPAQPDEPAYFYYDIMVIQNDGSSYLLSYGRFVVDYGVTVYA